MKPTIPFLLLLLAAAPSAWGQRRTWLNYDLGVSVEQPARISDMGPLRKTHDRSSVPVAFTLEQELPSNWSVEAGIGLSTLYEFDLWNDRLCGEGIWTNNPYVENARISGPAYICASAEYLSIPIRARYHLNMLRRKLWFVPSAGVNIMAAISRSGLRNTNVGFAPDAGRYFHGAEFQFDFGIGIEWLIAKGKLKLGVLADYRVTPYDMVRYTVRDTPTKARFSGNMAVYQLRLGVALYDWNRLKNKRNKP